MDDFFENIKLKNAQNDCDYDYCDFSSGFIFDSEIEVEQNRYFSKFLSKENGVKISTGFDEHEFYFLYEMLEGVLTSNYKGKGRKSKLGGKDRLLLVLLYLKHYDTIERISKIFDLTCATVNIIVTKTLNTMAPILETNFFMPIKKSEQLIKNIECIYSPEVALIVDATVFEIQKPTGLFEDVREYFSGKHYIYCLKTEVAVLPNGLCAFASDCYPGSVHDFTVFKSRSYIYENFCAKLPSDYNIIENDRELYWGILADKGYIGGGHGCRTITPPKKRSLTHEEKLKFKERNVVERYFGRTKMLFGILRSKFRGSRTLMNPITKSCFALANFHIMNNPLSAKDSNYLNKIKENLAMLKTEIRNKNATLSQNKSTSYSEFYELFKDNTKKE